MERAMTEESIRSASNGEVVAVRGSVVDIRFDGPLPPIHTVLHAGDDGEVLSKVYSAVYP